MSNPPEPFQNPMLPAKPREGAPSAPSATNSLNPAPVPLYVSPASPVMLVAPDPSATWPEARVPVVVTVPEPDPDSDPSAFTAPP